MTKDPIKEKLNPDAGREEIVSERGFNRRYHQMYGDTYRKTKRLPNDPDVVYGRKP